MSSVLSRLLTPFAKLRERTALAMAGYALKLQTRYQRRKLHRQVVARINALRKLEQRGMYVYNRGAPRVTALPSTAQAIGGSTATQPVPPSLAPADITAIKEQ